MVAHLKSCLTGNASNLVCELEGADYYEVVDKLRRRYGIFGQEDRFQLEMHNRRQDPTETMQELANDVERLVAKAYLDVPQTMYQQLYLECFLEALRDPELQCELHKARPTTLRDPLDEASRIEAVLHDYRRHRSQQEDRQIRGALATDTCSPKSRDVEVPAVETGTGSPNRSEQRNKKTATNGAKASKNKARSSGREIREPQSQTVGLTVHQASPPYVPAPTRPTTPAKMDLEQSLELQQLLREVEGLTDMVTRLLTNSQAGSARQRTSESERLSRVSTPTEPLSSRKECQ